jgi:hypothetical protein
MDIQVLSHQNGRSDYTACQQSAELSNQRPSLVSSFSYLFWSLLAPLFLLIAQAESGKEGGQVSNNGEY